MELTNAFCETLGRPIIMDNIEMLVVLHLFSLSLSHSFFPVFPLLSYTLDGLDGRWAMPADRPRQLDANTHPKTWTKVLDIVVRRGGSLIGRKSILLSCRYFFLFFLSFSMIIHPTRKRLSKTDNQRKEQQDVEDDETRRPLDVYTQITGSANNRRIDAGNEAQILRIVGRSRFTAIQG